MEKMVKNFKDDIRGKSRDPHWDESQNLVTQNLKVTTKEYWFWTTTIQWIQGKKYIYHINIKNMFLWKYFRHNCCAKSICKLILYIVVVSYLVVDKTTLNVMVAFPKVHHQIFVRRTICCPNIILLKGPHPLYSR